ncbi:MAG: D-Ala-D-Ala carboxypeptidase family metallohydrolase [Rhizobiaceae bacterium]
MAGHDDEFSSSCRVRPLTTPGTMGAGFFARVLPLFAAGMLLTSCTAGGGGVDTSGLTAILTPSAQDQSETAAPDQADSPQLPQMEVSQRPNGVPKLRPSAGQQTTNQQSTRIETTLVPAGEDGQQTQTTATQTATQAAQAAAQPEAKPLSLFARLTAPRSIQSTPQTRGQSPSPDQTEANAPTSEDVAQTAKPQAKKPTGIFANLFQNRSSSSANKPASGSGIKTTNNPSRVRLGWNTAALPGVRSKKDLFGTDIDEELELDQGVKLASVTNQARRGAHGLLLQRPDVKVGCFPPQLVRLLKMVQRKFGRTPIVTSGYRSRKYNRLIRGARNSMHIHCKAADIQVQGVSKARLARYLRSLPGRGGVGTYCHTKSVHLDIGKKRDWNRRCRRRRARKS